MLLYNLRLFLPEDNWTIGHHGILDIIFNKVDFPFPSSAMIARRSLSLKKDQRVEIKTREFSNDADS